MIDSTPTAKEFFELVRKHMPETKTVKEAYDKAEEECEKQFGRRRYSDYNSFRVVKHHYKKKKR
jgi:hypothetical protein